MLQRDHCEDLCSGRLAYMDWFGIPVKIWIFVVNRNPCKAVDLGLIIRTSEHNKTVKHQIKSNWTNGKKVQNNNSLTN